MVMIMIQTSGAFIKYDDNNNYNKTDIWII